MNASEARAQRREAERAERRRSERLAEKAERELEEERAEERRRQEAREEAEARAAEQRQRERRAELLARLRRERTVAERRAEARQERRRTARAERAEQERAEEARERAAAARREEATADEARRESERERRGEAAEQQVAARRAEAEESARAQRRLQQARGERRARSLEEERSTERAAEWRTANAERRAEERSEREAETEHRAQQLAERRHELLEERGRATREAQARQARLRELARERAAVEVERRRAEERRAGEARRREAERKAQAEQEARRRERHAAREAEPETGRLPWLRTEDGRVVEWGGMPRVLRGVNVVGLDDAAARAASLRDALPLDDQNLEELTGRWGVNVVRVSFGAGTILGAPPLLDQLDDLVDALAGSGVYTLLALVSAEGLPDRATHDAWAHLADRYQAQPGALFEPYAAEAPLGDGWPDAALELIHTIRSIHQSSLLLLPGSGGGSDLEGLPLRLDGMPVPNVVYTLRDTSGSRPRLDERFAAFARRNPVLVSEWANEGRDFGRSAIANAGLFERLDIGWCACNWNGPHALAETRFGLIVRRALAAPVRPALSPY